MFNSQEYKDLFKNKADAYSNLAIKKYSITNNKTGKVSGMVYMMPENKWMILAPKLLEPFIFYEKRRGGFVWKYSENVYGHTYSNQTTSSGSNIKKVAIGLIIWLDRAIKDETNKKEDA